MLRAGIEQYRAASRPPLSDPVCEPETIRMMGISGLYGGGVIAINCESVENSGKRVDLLSLAGVFPDSSCRAVDWTTRMTKKQLTRELLYLLRRAGFRLGRNATELRLHQKGG